MKNANVARSAGPHELNEERVVSQETDPRFTPGQFFREAGGFIAACLGLGLLIQLLLT